MSTATTEPRAPESSVQQSAGKSAADPPEAQTACDGLRRLAKRFPKQVEKILRVDELDCAGEGQCDIWDHLLVDVTKHGWACLADVAEFIENWTPAKNTEDPPNPEFNAAIAKGIENIAPGLGKFLKEQHVGERIRTIATPDLSEIRERVKRIAGLVEGAHIAERCFSDIGHSALSTVNPEDYLNAVCGSIDTARDELAKLQKLLGRNGGVS